MITLHRRIARKASRRMLIPAVLFFVCAGASAAGAGAVAALCLVPATLAIDAVRGSERKAPKDTLTTGDGLGDHDE